MNSSVSAAEAGHKGLLNGLAGVERFDLGDLPVARPQDVGGLPQDAPALDRLQRGPSRLRSAGGVNGFVDERGGGAMQARDDLAGGGVDAVERRSGRIIHE
jgi:hypothetical protein